MKKKHLMILGICYFAYISIYIARQNLSVVSPALISQGILNKQQIGLLGSVFSIIYSVGRLFNGSLSDRIKPCIMISLGLFFVGLSNIWISSFPSVFAMCMLWGVNAFAQSMLWSSILCIISALSDAETSKRISSYMVTSVATGNIAGILVCTAILQDSQVQYAFVIPGIITLIMFLAVLLTTGDIKAPIASATRQPIPLLKLLRDKEIRNMLFAAFSQGVIKDNVTLWMTVFFVDTFAIDVTQSAGFVLFIPVLGLVGRFLYPVLFRLCNANEHKVTYFAFLLCAFSPVLLLIGRNSPMMAVICLSVLYAATSMANTSILSIFPLRYAKWGNIASVSGIMDLVSYFGAAVGSAVYGVVISKLGYTPMFASWIILGVLAILMLKPLVRDTAHGE